MDLKETIRSLPDYPAKGIIFRDITPSLGDAAAFQETISQMEERVCDLEFTRIAGIEARGFIYGAALALKTGKGFIPIRKPGKLPCETYKEEYDLEYGTDSIEMHVDALEEGEKILIIDDLLATGGTSKAAAKLIEKAGGEVAGFLFFIELDDLKGREVLEGYDVRSLLHYE